ncbi:MAG: DUF2723 domain-containing protein [Caldilineaceae bacterium]
MKFTRFLPAIAGVAALTIYALNSAPSIVALFDDSLEFQLVGPTFGIAHPTGYPLYVILSGVWSRVLLPLGNWAWRMNLFSALCAAAALACLTWLAQQLYESPAKNPSASQGVRPPPSLPHEGEAGRGLAVTLQNPLSALCRNLAALTAAATFGLSAVWWSQATVAEVYALHILCVALLLGLTIKIGRDAVNPIWLALCLGLALTHHRTTVLTIPGLLLYLAWQRPRLLRPQKAWTWWLLALLTPLLLYLFIPLRAAQGVMDLHGSYANTWGGFWQHVLASGYTTFLGDNPLAVQRSPLQWLTLFNAQLGAVGLALALAGLWPLMTKRPHEGALLLATLLCNLLFALFYQTPDVEVFTLPVTLCLSLLIGAASWQIADWLTRQQAYAIIAQAAILVPLLLGLGGRAHLVNRSQQWDAHDYAVALAKVDFPAQSRVVGLEGEVTALRYMQQAEGLGIGASGVAADDPMQRRQVVADLMAKGAPVYLTRELAEIGDLYSFSAAGPLVRVWPRGQAQVDSPLLPLNAPFANGDLLLVGADKIILEQAGGPTLLLVLDWQPQTQLHQQYKVSLRLLDQQGKVLQQQDLFPLLHIATTDQWLPGETIRDAYYLRLSAEPQKEPASQPVKVLLILYDAAATYEAGRWEMQLP